MALQWARMCIGIIIQSHSYIIINNHMFFQLDLCCQKVRHFFRKLIVSKCKIYKENHSKYNITFRRIQLILDAENGL